MQVETGRDGILVGARFIQRRVPPTLLSSKDNFIWRKAMVQRRVVVTAKQGEENLKPMEVLLTGESVTEHFYKSAAGSFALQRSM